MNILVIGTEIQLQECKDKFGTKNNYQLSAGHQAAEKFFATSEVVFDFIIEKFPDQMEVYRDHPRVIAFLNSVKKSVLQLVSGFQDKIECTLFGFNGLPSFIGRDIFEVSLLKQSDSEKLKMVCDKLQTKYLVVEDRVGMVTPRVICMIINEAYYTWQEGTASKEDIDTGMKLGTNYPFGPFEWCKRIGKVSVYEVLEALYQDTKDERYKISAALKKEYLQALLNSH